MPKKFFSFCIVLAIRVPKSLIPLQVVEVGMYRQGVTEQIQCCVNGTKPPRPLPKCSKYLQIQDPKSVGTHRKLNKAEKKLSSMEEPLRKVCVCECKLGFYVCMWGENTNFLIHPPLQPTLPHGSFSKVCPLLV